MPINLSCGPLGVNMLTPQPKEGKKKGTLGADPIGTHFRESQCIPHSLTNNSHHQLANENDEPGVHAACSAPVHAALLSAYVYKRGSEMSSSKGQQQHVPLYSLLGESSLQALCVVQSPTSEEEPLGSNGQQPNCHHQQQQQQSVDGTSSSLEEAAGRCGTPSHRQSRRRRPLSTEPALSSSSAAVKPASGRNLAPPAPTTPVKSHYKSIPAHKQPAKLAIADLVAQGNTTIGLYCGVDPVMQTTSTWPSFERRRRRRRVRVNTLQLSIDTVNQRVPHNRKVDEKKKDVGINELLLEAFPCPQREERIQDSDPDWEDHILYIWIVCAKKGNDVTSSRIASK
ncbi:hypothetical protein DAPPUDRAFT_252676 [Daphnia pulex]|uniref:Uncharacterized protein n=1 Tax=Daphnia pulex TaxID=6669 RepID=E9H386_DAPPU|nr:hypothetical protein DAPPUDRAFT_252676 [Daphnia pulex]|eukprot:EFX73714.1 hypothetical protein DAPPUDRAFT_252676 [Daphnia pulex]